MLTGLGVGHNEGKGRQEGQEHDVDAKVEVVAETPKGTPFVLEKASHQGVLQKIHLLTVHLLNN